MDLFILSGSKAIEHEPLVPTYALRIFSTKKPIRGIRPLRDSPHYRRIAEYTFDDNTEHLGELGPTWIDDALAREMIDDFRPYRDSVQSFMTHCSLGENRSPAVAIAFNEIFEFGADRDELIIKYYKLLGGFNHHVCKTLLSAAGWGARADEFLLEVEQRHRELNKKK